MNNLIKDADQVKLAVDKLMDGIEKERNVIPNTDRNMKSDGVVFQCWRNMSDYQLKGKTISDIRMIPTLNKMIFKTWNNIPQKCDDNLVVESIKRSSGANYSYMTLVTPTTIKSKRNKQ